MAEKGNEKKADRFLDAGNDVHDVNHDKINITTQYAGYDATKMVADVNGVFREASMNDLHEVYDSTFEKECLHHFEFNKQAKLPSKARHDAIQNYKFFSRFKRSPIKQMLMGIAKASAPSAPADFATKLFFEQMGGAGANMDDLNELMAMDKEELGSRGFGKEIGKIKMWLDVRKLVRYIRKDWDFAGERSSNWRDCPYPADDVDYMHMQSHEQLTRVPLSSFMIPELFKLNLATKQLQVRKYREKIPGPPKRFMIIIDDSGSMSGAVAKVIDGQHYSGIAWALAIAICITKAAEGVDNKAAIGLFNTRVHAPGHGIWFEGNARQAEDFLWKVPYSGGGTDFGCAVIAANKFHSTKEPIEASIIISDCCAHYNDTAPLMPWYTVMTEGKPSDYPWIPKYSTKVIQLSQIHVEKPSE